MSVAVCPECAAGKHGNCDGSAWDFLTDEPTSCPCACNVEQTQPAAPIFPYAVITAPLGNTFGARSLEEVEHFKTIWEVTEVIDQTAPPIPPELCGVGGCVFTPHAPGTKHSWAPTYRQRPGETILDAERRELAHCPECRAIGGHKPDCPRR